MLFYFVLFLIAIIFFTILFNHLFWERKGIPWVIPEILDPAWYHNSSNCFYIRHVYKKLKGYKFGGCIIRFTPKIVICDPDIIKQILIKDFDYFHNRKDVTFDENEPLTMHLFSAPGKLWKILRTRLTPTFTSGKIKYMFSLVQECATEVAEVLQNEKNSSNIVDVRDYSRRYAIEVISSCAFGLKTDSIRTRDSTFKMMADKIFSINFTKKFLFWTRSFFPRVKHNLKLKSVNKSVTQFFFKIVQDTINYRKSNNVERNDFLQLLIELKEKDKFEIDENYKFDMSIEIITAQCYLFFLAGFNSASTVQSFTLLELAKNQQIQKKLHDEIDKQWRENGFQITYEVIENMKYLHQVILETMRMHPVFSYLNRQCMKKYRIPNSECIIEEGTEIIIPITGLHHDPKYFPNPEEFDPDRFSEDEIAKRNHYVYLPFGDGPRKCIGMRFGLLTVKLGLVSLLKNYRFELCEKTMDPVELVPRKIINTIKNPVWLKCCKRI